MMYPYVLLGLGSLLVVGLIWLAYEVGRSVGATEEYRFFRDYEPQWFSDDNEPF